MKSRPEWAQRPGTGDNVVMAPLEITASRADPALLDLPWEKPLEQWPEEILAALPRGISRHVVRFVRVSGRVLAIKEISHALAQREYETLKVGRMDVLAVEPFAVVWAQHFEGEPSATVRHWHLQFSLYRGVFSQVSRQDTAHRLLDALAVLLVAHLNGYKDNVAEHLFCREPARSPPTSSTSRPGLCTSSSPPASGSTTSTWPAPTSSVS